MFKCRLGDFNICFEDRLSSLEKKASRFKADFGEPDITVPITAADIEDERVFDNEENQNQDDAFFEQFAAFRKLGDVLPSFNAVVMHSCLVDAYGEGVAFTARSGTGKTTHMMLWKRLFGQKMSIVNGDKPIVRYIDGELRGYGTPWAGKEGLYENTSVPLKHICQIVRSTKNETIPMSKQEGIILLMQQVYMPKDKEMLSKTMEMINLIAEKVKFWKIKCNMEIEAAHVAQKAMFPEKDLDSIYRLNECSEPIVETNAPILHGTWTPSNDTDSVEFSDIPFVPKKISIYCNDVLFHFPQDDKSYFISCNVDTTALNCLVCGDANTKAGAITYAVSRVSPKSDAIYISSDTFALKELSLGGKNFFFAGGKTYNWTITG